MSLEGSTVYGEVAPPFVEGTIVSGSRSFRVWWERSVGRLPRLVFDGVKDMIDGYPE